MSYVVIIDMDQPGIRRFIGIAEEGQFELAEFLSVETIKELKAKHSLGAFEWLAIGVRENNGIELL